MGCASEESNDSLANPPAETSQETIESTPDPAIPVPEFDLPANNEEGSIWIRAHLTLYEQDYRECERMVDVSSPAYDPVGAVNTMRPLLTETARARSERAAWVAWTACSDGIAETPWPIPELEHLRPYP